jgi:DNA-binding Lrp family transcriptional regulator
VYCIAAHILRFSFSNWFSDAIKDHTMPVLNAVMERIELESQYTLQYVMLPTLRGIQLEKVITLVLINTNNTRTFVTVSSIKFQRNARIYIMVSYPHQIVKHYETEAKHYSIHLITRLIDLEKLYQQ